MHALLSIYMRWIEMIWYPKLFATSSCHVMTDLDLRTMEEILIEAE